MGSALRLLLSHREELCPIFQLISPTYHHKTSDIPAHLPIRVIPTPLRPCAMRMLQAPACAFGVPMQRENLLPGLSPGQP